MSESRTIEYRPHLDGLRAVAVLLVFVFHAAPAALPGGFIGVDMFFVLSGFLITTILLRQLDNPSPGILRGFYARRLKRLMPASIVLIAVVVLREAVWGGALEYPTRLREVRATLLYVANWNLIDQADDYFAEGLAGSPLRHMWSLAVEEQFYLVWPIVLVAVFRLGGRRRTLMLLTTGLSVLSAAAMVWFYDVSSVSRAYYGTDSRLFQPLLGALLAIALTLSRRPAREPNRGWVRRAIPISTALSLAALVLSTTWITGTSRSYYLGGAVVVAAATIIVILTLEVQTANPVRRILSWRPMVWLGQISYGFYLWHWPVILWLRPPSGASFADRRLVNLLQLGLTIALAVGSYVIVERTVRQARTRRVWMPFVGAAASIAAVLVLAGSMLTSPVNPLAESAVKDRSYHPCPDNPAPCVKVEPVESGAMTVALVGDSTAQAYDPAMTVLAKKYGFRYVHAAVGGCPIGHRLLATGSGADQHKPSNFTCFDETPGIYDEVLEEWAPDLILATSWNESNQHITDGVVIPSRTDEHLAQTRTALDDAIAVLTEGGAKVVFLSILPPGPTVECLSESPPTAGSCVRSVSPNSRESQYNQIFREVADSTPSVLGMIDLIDVICPGGACPLQVDEVVVRYDGRHFTGTQSRRLAPVLDERLRSLGFDLGAT